MAKTEETRTHIREGNEEEQIPSTDSSREQSGDTLRDRNLITPVWLLNMRMCAAAAAAAAAVPPRQPNLSRVPFLPLSAWPHA